MSLEAQPRRDVPPASAQWSAVSGAVSFAAAALMAFLITPIVIRTLGNERYGIYTLAGEFIRYYAFLDLGIRGAIGYFLSRMTAEKRPDQIDVLIRTAFWHLSLIGLGVAGVAALTAWFFPSFFNVGPVPVDEVRISVALLLLTFAVNLPCSIPNGILAGLRRYDLINLCQIVATLLSAIAIYLAARNGAGLVTISALQAGSSVLPWMLQAICVRRLKYPVPLWPPTWRSSLTRDLYKFGGANLGLNLVTLAGFQMDPVIIGKFLGAAAVSYLHIGRYLGMNLLSLVGSMSMVLPTAFTHEAASKDAGGLRYLFLKATRHITALSTLLSAGILVFGRAFLDLWVGPQYSAGDWWNRSDTVLALFVVSAWPRCVGMVAIQYLMGTRQLRFQTIVRSVESAVNLGLALVLVRNYGLAGVVVSKVVVNTLGSLVVIVPYCLRQIRIPLSVFAGQVLRPAGLVGAVTAGVGVLLTLVRAPANWPVFFAETGIAGGCGGAVLWYAVLDADQRRNYTDQVRLWSGKLRRLGGRQPGP